MKVIDEKQRGVGMGCPGDDAGVADVRDHRVDGRHSTGAPVRLTTKTLESTVVGESGTSPDAIALPKRTETQVLGRQLLRAGNRVRGS